MPLYEYRCTQCHRILEYQQRTADAAKTPSRGMLGRAGALNRGRRSCSRQRLDKDLTVGEAGD